MRIAVVGSGYVGLVTGTCLAELGHHVICVDINPLRIEALRQGKIPIYEPGLEDMVARNGAVGKLAFTTSIAEAVNNADVVFLAVGTPQNEGDGRADLRFLKEAAVSVARSLRQFTVIITKSTVPVGTGDELEALVVSENPNAEFVVVSNPEFLREGSAIEDFMRPDRIIFGLEDERGRPVLEDLYRPLGTHVPHFYTKRRNSELIKYASNAFLAMKVAFVNEMADLCEAVGGDVAEVAKGMGLDARIGPRFLIAGPGYGGSCFPKDTAALAASAHDAGSPMKLVEATISSNSRRKRNIALKVEKALGGSLPGKKIGVLGLTFKAGTDDMRDSPAIDILQALEENGASVVAYDPKGMEQARGVLRRIEFASCAEDTFQDADALLVLTEWPEFKSINPVALKKAMRNPLIFDFRNVLDAPNLRAAGLVVYGVGRTEQAFPAATDVIDFPSRSKKNQVDARETVALPMTAETKA